MVEPLEPADKFCAKVANFRHRLFALALLATGKLSSSIEMMLVGHNQPGTIAARFSVLVQSPDHEAAYWPRETPLLIFDLRESDEVLEERIEEGFRSGPVGEAPRVEPLSWSKELPTEEGFYWHVFPDCFEPSFCMLVRENCQLRVAWGHNEFRTSVSLPVLGRHNNLWCGPFTFPSPPPPPEDLPTEPDEQPTEEDAMKFTEMGVKDFTRSLSVAYRNSAAHPGLLWILQDELNRRLDLAFEAEHGKPTPEPPTQPNERDMMGGEEPNERFVSSFYRGEEPVIPGQLERDVLGHEVRISSLEDRVAALGELTGEPI